MLDISVQDLLTKELLESSNDENEMLQLLTFLKDNGVPITNEQASAIYMLQEFGVGDLTSYVLNIRQHMTPTKKYYDLVNKLTLADRIKGNAKLSGILKANANPNNMQMGGAKDGLK